MTLDKFIHETINRINMGLQKPSETKGGPNVTVAKAVLDIPVFSATDKGGGDTIYVLGPHHGKPVDPDPKTPPLPQDCYARLHLELNFSASTDQPGGATTDDDAPGYPLLA